MNRCRRILTGLLIFSIVFSLCRSDCLAAEKKEPYTYQITFYAGNQGIFAGAGGIEVVDADNRLATGRAKISASASVITVGGQKAGDTVAFDDIQGEAVGLEENSQYYVRGLRKGGYDNDTVDQPAFRVEQDQDYVVAYGVRGDMVSYVIHYQDASGNTLAPSRTYYGNVGDRPVVAFLYIEGYEPQAYNLTRTLSKNEAENVFIFVYSPVESGGSQGSGQGAEEGDGGAGEGAGDAGTAAAAPGTGPAAPGAGAEGTGGTAGAAGGVGGDGAGAADGGAAGDVGGVAAPDENVPLDEGPEDLVDLDRVEDEQIPLAETIPEGTRNMLGAAAVGVTAAAALLVLVVILARRHKKEAAREE